MRIGLVATIAALSLACGNHAPTAPTAGYRSVAPTTVPAAPLTVGNYEVVFTADAACGELPSVVQTRTYPARFDGVMLHLDGGDFGSWPPDYPKMNVLYVSLKQDSAYVYASDPPVWEHVTANIDLMIEGGAEGTVRGDPWELSFHGSFSSCPASRQLGMRCPVDMITCRSQDHRLTVTRK